MANDPCRFCKYYAYSVLGFAALMSAWTALPFVVSSSSAQAQRALGMGLVQSTAPAAAGTALVLALVLWAGRVTAPELGRDLPSILRRGALVAAPGFLVAAATALLVTAALLRGSLGAFPAFEPRGAEVLRGALATGLDTGLVLLLAWRFLGRLRAGMPNLAAMLIVVVTVTVPLRVTVALLASSLLPG